LEVKKTILFFSRCELVHLYGELHENLVSKFEVIHVAYSTVEANILKNKYGIENVIIFKNEFLVKKDKLKISDTFFEDLDAVFIKQTDRRFNLNSSLQSDRTFKKMTYGESLEITAVYNAVWKEIFSFKKIDFFIHEATSLMMNHIASVLCKEQGGVYTTHIMVQGESDYNFMMVDSDNGFPTEMISIYNRLSEEEIKKESNRIIQFLNDFRSSYEVFFDVMGTGKINFKFFINHFIGALKKQVFKCLKKNKFHIVNDSIELFLLNDSSSCRTLKNAFSYRNFKYDDYDPNQSFYFYPLHLEPEAVVLYWAEGLYSNQVKLIENIASQLPVGEFLYVKDHPHLYGYRDISDYKRIQNIPNVKFLAPNLAGKKIVKDSKGVITLNGTAGFEALLLNKQVITFGAAYYRASARVKNVRNIRDFRDIIYDLKNVEYIDDLELHRFVLAYLKCQKKGFTNFYGNYANELGINFKENIKSVADGLILFFYNYDNFEGKSSNQ
jgi:hypothetical protein